MAPTMIASLFTGLLSLTAAQNIGGKPENHPRITTQKCTTAGGCVSQNSAIVIDAGSHALLDTKTGKSCYNSTGGIDTSICNDAASCGKQCALQPVNYKKNGVTTSGDSLHLQMYLRQQGKLNGVSPRVYLLQPDCLEYEELQLVNQELSFDVDMSNLPCGMNAALYLGEMDADGGRGPNNRAGATYGTGYCDAQCYVPTWLNGELNTEGLGACCPEMDVWESNSRATGFTPHPCSINGFYGCEGDECSLETGVCDKYGCGFNPYQRGAEDFYGLGEEYTLDTTKPFTVTTQFISGNGKNNGRMTAIRRKYTQDGVVIKNVVVTVEDEEYDSITPDYCHATNGSPYFFPNGGLRRMGQALARGMVLTFSIWNDPAGFMNWLDSGDSGPCNATEGDPAVIQQIAPDTDVTFSNIKWGDIGSTA